MTRPTAVTSLIVLLLAGGCSSAESDLLTFKPDDPGTPYAEVEDHPTGGGSLAESDLLTFEPDDPRALFKEQENHLAECMRGKGFYYEPFLPPNEDPYSGPVVEYNVETDDPNWAYVRALSPEEYDRYQEALHGSQDSEDGVSGGCNDAAFAATHGFSPDELVVSGEQMAARDAAVDADVRVVAAEVAYIGCMADAGFDVPGVDRFDEYVRQSRDLLESSAASSGQAVAELEEYVELIEYETKLQVQHVECANSLYYPVRAGVEEEANREFLGDLPIFADDA